MRELVYTGFMTLDGVVDSPGRRSYEAFAQVWPDSDDHAAYKELPKYFVSTSLADDAVVDGWGPARASSAQRTGTSSSCACASPPPTPTEWRSSCTTSCAERVAHHRFVPPPLRVPGRCRSHGRHFRFAAGYAEAA